MIAPESALALARLAFFGAAITIFGWACFTGLLAPRRLGEEVEAASRRRIVAVGWLALAATLVWLPLQAAMIGGAWASAGDASMLGVLAFGTAIGVAWLVRLGLCVLLLGALAWRVPPALRVMLAGLLLASLASSGHANMHEGIYGALHHANDVLHVLAAAFWLGSLVMLPACLSRLGRPATRDDAALALWRFSIAGHGAVALVLMSGIANTLLVLGHLPFNAASPYQRLLAFKIMLVAAMIVVALANRYLFMPRLGDEPEPALRWMRRGTFAELLLGGGVLALVARFGLIDPM
jgi:putative copper resistance protein D